MCIIKQMFCFMLTIACPINHRSTESFLVHSTEQLFQYRRLLDKTVPQKGGTKEYAPDGSWLQDKRLESFNQERAAVLGEQRVEKLGSVVQAVWNPDRGLVEFTQEVGKFWSHMGFVDQSRKWLYPEEALFLMETCVLEVYYGEVPLSIQEAYSRLLGSDVSLEEYEAYAHLRRLGFVVLRHLGGTGITHYERKIRLDQHIKDSKRRRHDKGDVKTEESTEDTDKGGKKQKLDLVHVLDEGGDIEISEIMDTVKGNQQCVNEDETCSMEECDGASGTKPLLLNPWNIPINTKSNFVATHCQWDFDIIKFPDIADKDTVVLSIPNTKYIPPNVVISEEFEDICMFDVQDYRQQQQTNVRPRSQRQATDSYVFDLDFSYSDWARNRKKISAKNWTEYKEKLQNSQLSKDVRPSPASHLWEGEVTPLVRPQDATSTSEILSRLQVIQTVDLPQCDDSKSVDVKISFDVHLPNAKFKKTKPGLPNHRVCVIRSNEPPPTMADIAQVVARYCDNVPVNWAVVDSGDIAFYNMSSISLPVDVAMG